LQSEDETKAFSEKKNEKGVFLDWKKQCLKNVENYELGCSNPRNIVNDDK
jgi:hypothetical protein